VFFRVSLEVLGLRQHLKDGDQIEFLFSAPRSATVRVSKNYPNGDEPSETSSAVVIGATQEQIVDIEVASRLEVALSTTLDSMWANFRGTARNEMAATYDVIDRVFSPLQKAMRATVSILRWREGLMEGPVSPFRRMREFYSLDGEKWLEISAARSAKLTCSIGPKQVAASIEMCREIVDLVQGRTEEPLGHQLFREAWNLRGSNPRSALAIGVAAAEVGLKKLIGSLVPHASWLLDELQSPSFSKISRNFLPKLPVKRRVIGKTLRPPNKLLNKLDRAIEHRNGLVHAGKSPPDNEELEEMLRAVYDFLYVCDVYGGSDWAQNYISRETLDAWADDKASDVSG
jgi:hypothetical protein